MQEDKFLAPWDFERIKLQNPAVVGEHWIGADFWEPDFIRGAILRYRKLNAPQRDELEWSVGRSGYWHVEWPPLWSVSDDVLIMIYLEQRTARYDNYVKIPWEPSKKLVDAIRGSKKNYLDWFTRRLQRWFMV